VCYKNEIDRGNERLSTRDSRERDEQDMCRRIILKKVGQKSFGGAHMPSMHDILCDFMQQHETQKAETRQLDGSFEGHVFECFQASST
jgi:hypothetical protein